MIKLNVLKQLKSFLKLYKEWEYLAKYKDGYQEYMAEAKKRIKHNPLKCLYPKLPNKKYQILYIDPPWNYGGKMQFDRSSVDKKHFNPKKKIFISAANLKYPTLKLRDLKKLNVQSITAPDALLFMWTTGPQLENALKLGKAWGFDYKTVAFVWDKMNHNPGHYTMSQTEQVLLFKHGRIPKPRGARNIRQLVRVKRTVHSKKPLEVAKRIQLMFPKQAKIELFARDKKPHFDAWGLDV